MPIFQESDWADHLPEWLPEPSPGDRSPQDGSTADWPGPTADPGPTRPAASGGPGQDIGRKPSFLEAVERATRKGSQGSPQGTGGAPGTSATYGNDGRPTEVTGPDGTGWRRGPDGTWREPSVGGDALAEAALGFWAVD